MVVVSLGTLGGLMVGAREGYFVVLSLGLPLVSPLESLNPGSVLYSFFEYLTSIILFVSVGNHRVSLIGYIWHISWCGTFIGAYTLI